MYNFSKTESAKGVTFLTPGVYRLQPNKVEIGAFPKGTKYLGITFQTEDGLEITEKFVISEKALGRIQYLHEAFFGKKCDKDFDSEKSLETYFRKALTTKKIVKNIIISGEISGGNVYGTFGFTNFVDDKEELELGSFEEGSEEWKKYVKKRTNSSGGEVEGKANGILNEGDDADDAPIGAKGKAKTTTESKVKGSTKDVPKEDDGDDMPW